MFVREKDIESLRACFCDIGIKYVKLILLHLIMQGYLINDGELGVPDTGVYPSTSNVDQSRACLRS